MSTPHYRFDRWPSFRQLLLILAALATGSGGGCTEGVSDSSSINECYPGSSFACTCASGGSGLAYCLQDKTIEYCRCDGSMPIFPDAGPGSDASVPPVDGSVSSPDAAAN